MAVSHESPTKIPIPPALPFNPVLIEPLITVSLAVGRW